MDVLFNRNAIRQADSIEQPPTDVVKNTPSLWQADLDTAVRYGGELTRAALGAMRIRGDKKHVVVDTKVHMLMPGQCPAIPGWHTDGAPREIIQPGDWDGPARGTGKWSPTGNGPADLTEQEEWDRDGHAPRFHLLVTGTGCLTEFMLAPWTLGVPDEATHDLYALVTRSTEALRAHLAASHPEDVPDYFGFVPSCRAVEWDWWNLHQGVVATKREWRFLIRVTETDRHEPLPPSRLHEIIRTQQMIYTPTEFGW